MATGKMVQTLPPNPDYILSVAFSKNSLWIATGVYDRTVNIINIASSNLSYRKRSHKGAVTSLKFMNNQKLISGDKMGELIIWNYPKGVVLNRLASMNDRIIDIVFNGDETYMFCICENNKKISIYDMETYELVTNDFIKLLEQPSSIEYVPETNYLIIGTVDGSLYFYDVFEDEKKLIEYMNKNDYEQAYKLIYENPFLKKTLAYQQLEEKWEKSLALAQKKLEESENDVARQILAPFLKVSSKRAIINSLLNDFSQFSKFKEAVLNKKYPFAYSAVMKYPYLKSTIYYQKMEDEWKKIFNKSKKLISMRGREDEVKELLKPFRGVTNKTPFIQSLFNEKQLYSLLAQKLAKREFQDFFDIVNRHPFLTESDEYKKAITFAENLLKQAKIFLKKGEFSKVINIVDMLEDFPQMLHEVDELKEQANVLLTFQRILAANDLNEIEKFVKEHPFLEEVEDYQNIEKIWMDKFHQAEIYSSKGDVLSILDELQDYMQIEDKKIKIGQLVKSGYLYQLLSLLSKQAKNQNVSSLIKKGVKNYIKLFGFDIEIGDIIEKAKKLNIEIDLSDIKEGDLTTWHHYNIPKKIWEDFE